jgi:diguanylate cyclase (GGDEF)-like protein
MMANPRILIVDDVADNRAVLARRFRKRNFEIVEAEGGVKALELIGMGSFDAILLDITMPDLDGLEVLRRIRLEHSLESLPVIMVTGSSQSTDVVEALERGANDFVSKPIDFPIALARVKAQVERKHDREALGSANLALVWANEQLRNEIANRKRSEAQTQYLARHDALTGLGNRTLFREELQLALGNLGISGQSLAVLFLDLDGFKSVNDTHGHSIGDAVLKTLASRMLDSLGNSVQIARLNGDEFAILQSSRKQPEAAMLLGNQLLQLVGIPCRIDAVSVTVAASIGIAVCDGDEKDLESLLRSADLAMQNAKEDGGGAYRLCDPVSISSPQFRRRREMS